MILVNKGIAQPWECDVMGHWTTRFYMAMFDDASYHLLLEAFGWSGGESAGGLGWADVRHVIEYRDEVSAGDVLEIRAGLLKIGGKSFTALYELTNLSRGRVAATLEAVCVFFDLQARRAIPLTDAMRASATPFLLPPEDGQTG
jgi:acyl-CoA thioester hydrolase